MRVFGEVALIAAVTFAVAILWRMHRLAQQRGSVPPPGAPPGSLLIPLGQFAVRPDKQWLILKQGM